MMLIHKLNILLKVKNFVNYKMPSLGVQTSSGVMNASRTFDFLVIGGGSGGIASARRAAEFGPRVALIENARLGGTCVSTNEIINNTVFNVDWCMSRVFSRSF